MNTKFFQMQHNIATEHSAADMINMAEILSKCKIIYSESWNYGVCEL